MNLIERNHLTQDIFLSLQTFQNSIGMANLLEKYGIEITKIKEPTHADIKKLLESASEEILLKIANDLKFEISNYISNENEGDKQSDTKDVFICHSPNDSEIVRSFAQILEVLGVKRDNITCTSLRGYKNFNKHNSIQENLKFLDHNVLVFFMVSNDFYESPDCMVEMGLAFEKTENQIFVAIAPFELHKIQNFFQSLVGINIDDESFYDNIREVLEVKLGIESKKSFPWKPMHKIFLKLLELQLKT